MMHVIQLHVILVDIEMVIVGFRDLLRFDDYNNGRCGYRYICILYQINSNIYYLDIKQDKIDLMNMFYDRYDC